ncbi:MAG: DNA polymerase III subunit beta [Candidatus Omnitrophota bacterium]
MDIKLTKENLQKGIQTVQNAASQKSSLPILFNILLETVKNNKIRLVATDLEIGIISTIDAEIQEEGAISIPAKKISDIVKELPGIKLSLSAKKNNQIIIKCEKSTFKMMGLPKDEFPKVPELVDKDVLTLPQKLLKTMLNMTLFAVSKDETRYILTGVLFMAMESKLRLVATDGRRLATIEKEIPKSGGLVKKVIIPTKAVSELTRILKDEGEVKISFSENQLSFELDDTLLITRLIEGEYPNYEQVIPKQVEEKIRLNKDLFYSAIKRASLFTAPDSQSIKLEAFKNKLIISKSAQDGSESREEIDCDYNGEEMTMGFNPNYLMDVLKNIDEEEVGFELTSPDKPGVIRAGGNSYIYIILPMQLG